MTVDNCIDTCLILWIQDTMLHFVTPRLTHSLAGCGLCLILETCRGSDNDHSYKYWQMYSLSTGVVPSVSSVPMMSWEPIMRNCVSVGFWVWDIGARRTHDPGPSQSQSSFVRLDKVICFYPPWSESNWMIKWQSFMFHHLRSTITQQVCGKE